MPRCQTWDKIQEELEMWCRIREKYVTINKAERSQSEVHFDIRHGNAEFRVFSSGSQSCFGPLFPHMLSFSHFAMVIYWRSFMLEIHVICYLILILQWLTEEWPLLITHCSTWESGPFTLPGQHSRPDPACGSCRWAAPNSKHRSLFCLLSLGMWLRLCLLPAGMW